MRYANEATPQGSTTRTLPQEYHTLVTTGQYYMRILPQDRCTTRGSTTPLLPQDSATRLLPQNSTTCCYHMILPQLYII